MSRETLNSKFWQASKILRQDDNTNSLLDYVEQISWLLFLKCFEELEEQRRAESEFEGKTYKPIISKEYQWSSWTSSERRLTGTALIDFLTIKLFPYLRTLQGSNESNIIRSMFAETPSKMLKDGGILRDAIDVINGIEFQTAEDVHTLSHLYESMLSKLGREGGMGGEFYTPRPIIEFIVKMVNPKLGETVYDPAMGSAGFLVEAHKYMRTALGNEILLEDEHRLQRETFFGQEKKPLPFLLGCMNMVLHGVLTPSLSRRNTLADDVRKFTEKDRFNVILTNPPFGGTEHSSVTANFRFPSKATSITFLQHIMEKVRRGGRVGMVIDEGVLFKTTERAYVDTKKDLLEKFNLHTIISLPAGVFANAVASGTGPKTTLLFFNREVNEQGEATGTKEIWYYEVQAVGFSLSKTQRPVSENDLPDCFDKAQARAISTRSWVVPVEEIITRNYDLSPQNPTRVDDYEHRSPEALIADVMAKEERVLQLLTEVQEMLDEEALEVNMEAVA
jgi:type I restriction enzyme M protein